MSEGPGKHVFILELGPVIFGGDRGHYHIYEKPWIACPKQNLCMVSKSKKKIVKETWIDITIYV